MYNKFRLALGHANCGKLYISLEEAGEKMVGATGFEPAACWSQTSRATKLRHAPTKASMIPYLVLGYAGMNLASLVN